MEKEYVISETTKTIYDETENIRSLIKILNRDIDYIKYCSFNETLDSILDVKNHNDLDKILNKFCSDFKFIGIILSYKNFNYTRDTLSYMKLLFNKKSTATFFNNLGRTDIFLKSMYLCIRRIIFNNSKLIYKNINSMIISNSKLLNIDSSNILDIYYSKRKDYNELFLCDENRIRYVLKENKNIYKKLDNIDKTLGQVTRLKYDKIKENEENYFNHFNDLYYYYLYFNNVLKFKNIFDELINIHNKSIRMDIKHLIKDYNKLLKVKSKIKENDRLEFNNIIETLFSKEMDISHNVYLNSIRKSINKNTNLYDAIYISSKYHNELSKICSKTEMEEYRHLIYDHRFIVLKNINLFKYDEMIEVLDSLFKSLELKKSISDYNKNNINNLEALSLYSNILNSNKTFKDFKKNKKKSKK